MMPSKLQVLLIVLPLLIGATTSAEADISVLNAYGNREAANVDMTVISLDPSDWIVNDAHDWEDYTANYTKQTTGDGYLRVTRTTADPASGWGAHLRTSQTFAFTEPDMEYSVFRYKWRANGFGTYCSTHGGPGAPQSSGLDNPWLWGPTGRLTTEWSWAGSIVVEHDEWVFTQLIINGDRTWTCTTGYGDYGGRNPLTAFSGTLNQEDYDALGDTYFRHSTADNYAAGQYFEIAEATIEIIPEPATLAFLAVGGFALSRKRRRT